MLQTRHKHTFKLHRMCQFGQLVLRKIITTVATRSHILKPQCTKFTLTFPATPLAQEDFVPGVSASYSRPVSEYKRPSLPSIDAPPLVHRGITRSRQYYDTPGARAPDSQNYVITCGTSLPLRDTMHHRRLDISYITAARGSHSIITCTT